MTSSTAFDHADAATVEPDPPSCSSTGAVGHRHVVEFDTRIGMDGSITVGPINDEDWEHVGQKIMSIVTALAGDKPIGFSDCLDPQRAELIAHRLAARIVGGA